jgi:hypothetical protein
MHWLIWGVIGVAIVIGALVLAVAALLIWAGRQERRLDDGDPRNPYSRWPR